MTSSTFWPTGPTPDTTMGSGGFTKYTSDTYVFQTLDEDNATYASRTGTSKNTWYGNKLSFTISSVIPSGATINSVTLTTEWYCSANDSAGPVLRLGCENAGSSIGTTSDTSGQTGVEVLTYAGTTPTVTQLRSATFYATLEFERTDNTAHVAYVDYVKLVVDWSLTPSEGTGTCKVQLPLIAGSATASQPIGTGAFKLQRPIIAGTATNVLTTNWESDLTSLSGGTTYHVRAWATNDSGATYAYGNELDFTTNYTATGGIELQLPLVGGSATASQPVGTGAFKLQAPLLSGSATNVPPPRAATGGLRVQSPLISSSATNVPPPRSATGTSRLQPALVGGTATATQPTATGTAKLQLPLITGAATNVPPPRSASGGLLLQRPFVSASGTASQPIGSGGAKLQLPLIAGDATNTPPVSGDRDGAAAFELQPVLLSGTATASQPIGSGSFKLQTSLVGGAATATQPIGTGSVRVQLPLIGGTATASQPLGTGNLKLQLPLVSGAGTASQPVGTGGVRLQRPVLGASGTATQPLGTGSVKLQLSLLSGTGTVVNPPRSATGGIKLQLPVVSGTGATGEVRVASGTAKVQLPLFGGSATASQPLGSGAVKVQLPLVGGTGTNVPPARSADGSIKAQLPVISATATNETGGGTPRTTDDMPGGDPSGAAVLVAEDGFVSMPIDLNQSTHYYLRAWARNDLGGIAYGSTLEFWTTATPTNPERTGSAILQAAYTSTEGESGSAELVEPGGFVSLLDSLEPDTHYYVRAYAQSLIGIGYGNAVEFDSAAPTQDDATGSATLLGEKTMEKSGSAVLAPPVGYASSLTPLVEDTHYYVRAWAQSLDGVGYGAVVEFDTPLAEEGSATGSAELTLAALASGSAELQQLATAKTFRGLMGMLLHAVYSLDLYDLTSGSATLRAELSSDVDGSAVLVPEGMLLGTATGEALLELPPVVFRGLMGMLLHARRSGLRWGAAGGSALLRMSYLEVGYAYGSARLARERSFDVSGDAALVYDPTPEVDGEGSAHLQGAAIGSCTGSADLAFMADGDGEGSAGLAFAIEADGTGSASLIADSDGSSTGSAALAIAYSRDARGSAMLRTIHKGKTRHPRRTDTTPTLTSGGKIAHMRRRSRKGMMDQWP